MHYKLSQDKATEWPVISGQQKERNKEREKRDF
jgi:hypothetical protein